MSRRGIYVLGLILLCIAGATFHLLVGRNAPLASDVMHVLFLREPESYDQAVVLHQRLPRLLIAIYSGGITAMAGCVLQALIRNPLASPSTMGINAGATLGVVAGAFILDLEMSAQGVAALVGAIFGFASSLLVSRAWGASDSSRGLPLILAGALTTMLFTAATTSILLSDPARRADFLGWVNGNINHVYFDRLAAFWWMGAASLALLIFLAKPLTLITLGSDKAASAGVDVRRVSWAAIGAVMIGSGSAVAICGPIGFVGLVGPHLVRPLVGSSMTVLLPAATVLGAAICVIADLFAREAFQPFVVHTGILMDLLGGLAFVLIVRRFYLRAARRVAA